MVTSRCRRTMPVSTTPDDIGARVLQALCSTTGPDPLIAATLSGGGTVVGNVLVACVLTKTLCLLAAHQHTHPTPGTPRELTAFLARTLRANRHKSTLYRREAATVTAALRDAGVRVAVVGGVATDLTAHGGTGAREFSDLDLVLGREHHRIAAELLDGLGYRPGAATATWTRSGRDLVTPLFVVDLHAPDQLGLESAVLDRTDLVAGPEGGAPLPVLAPTDALAYSLHRLIRCDGRLRWPVAADALRQHRTLPVATGPRAVDLDAGAPGGWARLRGTWLDVLDPPYEGGGA